MNELRLLIVTIPSAFGLLMALDFVSFLYRESQLHGVDVPDGDRLALEASQLCDRLVEVERLAFQQYLKAPDTHTLQQAKRRLEHIRQIYPKAEQRYQRRTTRSELQQVLESMTSSRS
ncbi:MAG TPA: hypothetical protein IGS17_07210 [Oscillatoriales cyanobacterium M59_W2019_021]|nr:MAG: hypothetical protein D6728_00060 [Cyanobacteria bacterium J055]HIK50699.1 hypothetical protein [Oscillatoriales cyanobacterium M59_W2019_021]